ncbi:hypothetical protein BO79DRAFT_221841 [Aspergillus costaricaensis CBS 115574]|uniref:Uncharacterized protein n=1 Tax=Aspergillus costaricaensis CBS 115574 TaxID=1448317 RepID=A0ACD1I155_9EURO|nr:hypothetical protein BO79DRAFT_221841 [Aspergillus costaricaensis CBS 115574]RAK84188.1 hypothetical protein BO79DRAFT_221841 [Aspergillus costaricaensis CBS 115574]
MDRSAVYRKEATVSSTEAILSPWLPDDFIDNQAASIDQNLVHKDPPVSRWQRLGVDRDGQQKTNGPHEPGDLPRKVTEGALHSLVGGNYLVVQLRDEPNVGHAVSVGAARSRPMQVSLRENGGHTRPGGDIHVQDIRHGHNGQSCGRLLRRRTRQMSERARLRPGDEFTRARGTEWAWMNPPAVATEDIIGMSWHSLTTLYPSLGLDGRQSCLMRKWEFLFDHPQWGQDRSTGSGTGAGPGSFPVVGSG